MQGPFEAALDAARELGRRGTHALVNSLNPHRLEGQKTAAFEIVEELGGAPDVLALPYGGGGNMRAYALGFEEADSGLPPILAGEASERAFTMATAIRIAAPAHRAEADEAVARSGGSVVPLADDRILAAWQDLARLEGVFCEPSSAAGLAALVRERPEPGARVVCVITGHGLKDPETAARLSSPADPGRRRTRTPSRRRRRERSHVRAPATTANLGAGFDCAAVALDLWNEVEISDGEETPDRRASRRPGVRAPRPRRTACASSSSTGSRASAGSDRARR